MLPSPQEKRLAQFLMYLPSVLYLTAYFQRLSNSWPCKLSDWEMKGSRVVKVFSLNSSSSMGSKDGLKMGPAIGPRVYMSTIYTLPSRVQNNSSPTIQRRRGVRSWLLTCRCSLWAFLRRYSCNMRLPDIFVYSPASVAIPTEIEIKPTCIDQI